MPATKKHTVQSVLPVAEAHTSRHIGTRAGILRRTGLTRLLEQLVSRVLIRNAGTEMLFHIPTSLSPAVTQLFQHGNELDHRQIYLCQNHDRGVPGVSCLSVAFLPPRHKFTSELLVVAAGTNIACLITARHHRDDGADRQRGELWQTTVTFHPTEVASAIGKLLKGSKPELASLLKASAWLSEKAAWLKTAPAELETNPFWGDILIDLTFGLEETYQQSEGTLRWLQTLNRVQTAVGWQLNTGDLFTAIADVLKKTVGYHYLEVELLEPRGKQFEVTAVHHRNDTDYGGPLLTVILKPKAQAEVVRRHRPILLTSEQAAEMMMNPRLLGFMGFNSGILLPLLHCRRPSGLLKLFSTNRNQYTSNDLALMEAIGQILAKSVENVKAHTLFRRMATVDGLTNIYNRRFFMEQMSREFKRARRYHSVLTMIMLDIDYFKLFNDTYGHLRGDRVLHTIAAILKTCVREVDLVARYGGEEFAVLLPEANLDQGVIVAEKIRQAVETHHFKLSDRKSGYAKVTVSLGICTLTSDLQHAADLVNRADMALYRAKKEGRNRCVTF